MTILTRQLSSTALSPKYSNMKKLIIMQGIPGSGKSYDAQKHAGEDGVILSTDDFWCLNIAKEYRFNPAQLGVAHSWNKDRCRKAMKDGIPTIVIDNTNTVAREWHPYDQMAKQNGYEVSFASPTSDWWNNIIPRIKDGSFTDDDVQVFVEKNSHGVPADAIRKMMERFTLVE